MSNKNCFKDIGTSLSKEFMLYHVTEMHLMTPKMLKCSADKFRELYGPNQKSLS